MPARRHPVLKNFVQQCIASGNSAKESFKKYLEEGIAEKIGRNQVSERRFLNIFYEERASLRNTYETETGEHISWDPKVTGNYFSSIPRWETNLNWLTRQDFSWASTKEGYNRTGSVRDQTNRIGDEVLTDRPPQDTQGSTTRQVLLSKHGDMAGTVFGHTRPQQPEFYASWNELSNFYRTFKLDTLYDSTKADHDRNCSTLTLRYWTRLVDWHTRIKGLSNGADSAEDIQMRKMARQLRVLAAEHLTFWESSVVENSFDSSRPKVEEIFHTEFWKWPSRNFPDIILNSGATRPNTENQQNTQLRNSPISTLMETWVIIPTDNDADEDEISYAPYQDLLRTLTKGTNNSAGSEFRIDVPIEQKLAEFRGQSYIAEYVPPETLNVPEFQRKNDHTIESLVKAIKEYGFTNPIFVIKETNTILDGTQRWWAAKELGIDQIPVYFISLDPESHARFSEDGNLTLEEDSLDTFYIRNPLTELLKTRRFPLTYFFLNTARLLGRKYLIKHPLDMADDTSLKAWALKINKQEHPGEWSSEAERVFNLKMSR